MKLARKLAGRVDIAAAVADDGESQPSEGFAVERLSDYARWPRAQTFAKVAAALARGDSADVVRKTDGGGIAGMMYAAMDTMAAKNRVMKTAAPQSTSTSPWDTDWSTAAGEFLQIVYERSIVGRLPAARRIPFRTAVLGARDATAGWVADAGAKIVTQMDIDRVTILPRKVSAITVIADDILRASPIDAEAMLLGALSRGCALALDAQFVSTDAASSALPAGALAAAQTIASTGTTVAEVSHDLSAMIALATAAGVGLSGAAWTMSPAAYAFLRMTRIANDDGTLGDFPVLTSDAASGVVALLATQYIFVAGDDVATLSSSTDAMLDMAGGNSPTYSLFEKDSTALRAEIFANWTVTGPTDSNGDSACVISLTGASWA